MLIQEFEIDIVGEDSKTIIDHKVAARVEQHQHQLQRQQHAQHHQNPSTSPAPGVASSLSGRAWAEWAEWERARSWETFDHILSQLQGKLQKSHETGAELHNLTGAMNDIQDTLSGSLVSCSAVLYILTLVKIIMFVATKSTAFPVNSPSRSAIHNPKSRSTQNVHPPLALLIELQPQLHETQSSLSTHVDKARVLEMVFAEHSAIKREVGVLCQLAEKRDRENGDFSAAKIISTGSQTIPC